MPKPAPPIASIAIAAFLISLGPSAATSATRTVESTETKFGLRVTDPYRWMEGSKNDERDAWLRAQGDSARSYLERLPGRDALYARLRDLERDSGSSFGVRLAGGRTFYFEVAPNSQVPKLMVREPGGKTRVLVDPATTRGRDGAHAALESFTPSPDGTLLGYLASQGGSEVCELRIMDVATGDERADVIGRIWGEFPPSWLPDGTGFYYTQMSEPDSAVDPLLNMRVRFHRLGAPVDLDPVVLAGDRAPSLKLAAREFPFLIVSPASEWAYAMVAGARKQIRVEVARLSDLDLSGKAATPWTPVAGYEDGIEAAELHGDRLYLLSTKNASGGRVLSVPLKDPTLAKARVEVAEDSEGPLDGIAGARDALYVLRRSAEGTGILRLEWGGTKAAPLRLPYVGSIRELASDPIRNGVTFGLTGWTRPATIFLYDPAAAKALVPLVAGTSTADFSEILVETVEATSADGTRVPLSIRRRRDLKLDGSHPAILYGYGAYGTPQTPGFNAGALAWLERGGILATAHVRGGGEKGNAWRVAGSRERKMNGVQDFIACAEHLVSRGYTSPSRLACVGGSAGGVLLGRAITTRPDLFAAAHIGAGLMNPLRILAAENGANQIAELGDPETEAGFRGLYAMDPYQHVSSGTAYPAVIFTIGLNDRRVAPWMTAKMAARLQASTTGGKPVLIRVDPDSGHRGAATRDEAIASRADTWSFLLSAMGDPAFQPTRP